MDTEGVAGDAAASHSRSIINRSRTQSPYYSDSPAKYASFGSDDRQRPTSPLSNNNATAEDPLQKLAYSSIGSVASGWSMFSKAAGKLADDINTNYVKPGVDTMMDKQFQDAMKDRIRAAGTQLSETGLHGYEKLKTYAEGPQDGSDSNREPYAEKDPRRLFDQL